MTMTWCRFLHHSKTSSKLEDPWKVHQFNDTQERKLNKRNSYINERDKVLTIEEGYVVRNRWKWRWCWHAWVLNRTCQRGLHIESFSAVVLKRNIVFLIFLKQKWAPVPFYKDNTFMFPSTALPLSCNSVQSSWWSLRKLLHLWAFNFFWILWGLLNTWSFESQSRELTAGDHTGEELKIILVIKSGSLPAWVTLADKGKRGARVRHAFSLATLHSIADGRRCKVARIAN